MGSSKKSAPKKPQKKKAPKKGSDSEDYYESGADFAISSPPMAGKKDLRSAKKYANDESTDEDEMKGIRTRSHQKPSSSDPHTAGIMEILQSRISRRENLMSVLEESLAKCRLEDTNDKASLVRIEKRGLRDDEEDEMKSVKFFKPVDHVLPLVKICSQDPEYKPMNLIMALVDACNKDSTVKPKLIEKVQSRRRQEPQDIFSSEIHLAVPPQFKLQSVLRRIAEKRLNLPEDDESQVLLKGVEKELGELSINIRHQDHIDGIEGLFSHSQNIGNKLAKLPMQTPATLEDRLINFATTILQTTKAEQISRFGVVQKGVDYITRLVSVEPVKPNSEICQIIDRFQELMPSQPTPAEVKKQSAAETWDEIKVDIFPEALGLVRYLRDEIPLKSSHWMRASPGDLAKILNKLEGHVKKRHWSKAKDCLTDLKDEVVFKPFNTWYAANEAIESMAKAFQPSSDRWLYDVITPPLTQMLQETEKTSVESSKPVPRTVGHEKNNVGPSLNPFLERPESSQSVPRTVGNEKNNVGPSLNPFLERPESSQSVPQTVGNEKDNVGTSLNQVENLVSKRGDKSMFSSLRGDPDSSAAKSRGKCYCHMYCDGECSGSFVRIPLLDLSDENQDIIRKITEKQAVKHVGIRKVDEEEFKGFNVSYPDSEEGKNAMLAFQKRLLRARLFNTQIFIKGKAWSSDESHDGSPRRSTSNSSRKHSLGDDQDKKAEKKAKGPVSEPRGSSKAPSGHIDRYIPGEFGSSASSSLGRGSYEKPNHATSSGSEHHQDTGCGTRPGSGPRQNFGGDTWYGPSNRRNGRTDRYDGRGNANLDPSISGPSRFNNFDNGSGGPSRQANIPPPSSRGRSSGDYDERGGQAANASSNSRNDRSRGSGSFNKNSSSMK